MCDTNTQRRPYGELGSVDKSSTCGCCVGVSSGADVAASARRPRVGTDLAVAHP